VSRKWGLVDLHCFGLIHGGGIEVSVHGLVLVRRGVPTGSFKSTEGLAMSRAKIFGGTVVRPDAILANSSASSLYLRGTWLSSRPSNLSLRRCTALQYASIFGSRQLDSFMT